MDGKTVTKFSSSFAMDQFYKQDYLIRIKRNRLLTLLRSFFLLTIAVTWWINILSYSAISGFEVVIATLLSLYTLYNFYDLLVFPSRFIINDQGIYHFHISGFSCNTFIAWNDLRRSHMIHFNFFYKNSGYFIYMSLKEGITPPTLFSKIRACFGSSHFKIKLSGLNYPPQQLNELINKLIESDNKQQKTEIMHFLAQR